MQLRLSILRAIFIGCVKVLVKALEIDPHGFNRISEVILVFCVIAVKHLPR